MLNGDDFPELEQADINVAGTRYQIAVCVVSLGTGGISGIVSQLGKCEAGGSGGLNFKVVGSETQPADPAENTIWVNTADPLTGYSLSPVQPEEPYEGMVWILVGKSGSISFNALKRNEIRIYPLSAMQYTAGAWISVTAEIFQNGEWVDWIDWDTYLLTNGAFNPNLGEIKCYAAGAGQTFAVETTADGVKFVKIGGGYGEAYSAMKFDFTDATTMLIVCGEVGPRFMIGLSAVNIDTDWWNSSPAVMYVESNTTNKIDLSKVSGQYYLAFAALDAGEYNLTEIRLER